MIIISIKYLCKVRFIHFCQQKIYKVIKSYGAADIHFLNDGYSIPINTNKFRVIFSPKKASKKDILTLTTIFF